MQQCWRIPAGGVFGRAETGRSRPGSSRKPALQAFAKLKYKTNIAQNHSRKSAWTNIDYDRLYTQPAYNPSRQLGPIKLQPLPGRGRGLVAEREIPLAETVLLAEAVGGALTGPEGAELRPQHLAEHLAGRQREGRLGPADRARLRLLYDGSAPDSPTALRNRAAALDDFRRLEDKLRRAAEAPKKPKGKGFGAAAAASASAAGQAGSGIDAAALGEAPLEPEELSRLVSFNSWGNSFGEVGATALRREASEAIIGIWPEFALVNHSCAPNTTAFAVGQRMLLQAVRDIPAGGEVTTSYLGELALAPRQRRREWLRGAYGFECECERCKAEAAVPSAVSAAVDAAYAAASSEEASALAGEAAGRSDRGALAPLEGRLEAAVGALEGAVEGAGLGEQLRVWLRASAYNAYYTRAAIRDLPEAGAAGGGLLFGRGAKAPFSDPAVPADLAAVVSEVAAGTDLHLYLTLEALSRSAEAFPRDDPRVAEATKACLRAHILRYGRTSDGVLRELLQARSAVPHYLGRISLPAQQQQQDLGQAQSEQQQRDAGSLVSEPLFGSAAWVAASPVQLREAAAAAAAELAGGSSAAAAAAGQAL